MSLRFSVELTINQIERLVVEIQEEIEEGGETEELISQQAKLEKILFAYDRSLI